MWRWPVMENANHESIKRTVAVTGVMGDYFTSFNTGSEWDGTINLHFHGRTIIGCRYSGPERRRRKICESVSPLGDLFTQGRPDFRRCIPMDMQELRAI